jgi:hypothetical protein
MTRLSTGQENVQHAQRMPRRLSRRTLHRPAAPSDANKPRTASITFGFITSQIAIITALLYYVGWVITDSFYSYFGINHSMLRFTPPDYILRSANTIFLFVIIAGVGFVLLVNLHYRFLDVITVNSDRRRRCLTAIHLLRTVFIVVAVVTLVRILVPTRLSFGPNTVWAASFLLACISLVYLDHVADLIDDSPRNRSRTHLVRRARKATLAVLTGGALVWVLSLYAQQAGKQRAVAFVHGLRDAPEVIVYSAERLALRGPGVDVDEITQPDSRYHFRYRGLHLLTEAAGRYILLPSGWTTQQGQVSFLPDSSDVRLDVRP